VDTVKSRILHLINTRENGVKSRFAERIGIHSGQLNNYIKPDNCNPGNKLRQKIADTYGVPRHWVDGYGPLEPDTAPGAAPPPAPPIQAPPLPPADDSGTVPDHRMPASAIYQLATAKTEARLYKEWLERDTQQHERVLNEYFARLDGSLSTVIGMVSKIFDNTHTPDHTSQQEQQRARTSLGKNSNAGKPTAPQ
jgi:hypothetical protein